MHNVLMIDVVTRDRISELAREAKIRRATAGHRAAWRSGAARMLVALARRLEPAQAGQQPMVRA